MSDDSLYKQNIIDHYKAPRNQKRLEKFTHHSEKANRSCGDEIEVWLDMDANGVLVDIGYEIRGCAISVAGISMLSEKLMGKTIEEIDGISEEEIDKMLGITPGGAREKCAVLGLGAIRKALKV